MLRLGSLTVLASALAWMPCASLRAQDAAPEQPLPEEVAEAIEEQEEEEAAEAHEAAVEAPPTEEPSVVQQPFDIPVEEPTVPFEEHPDTPAVEAADEPVPAEELRFWGVRERLFLSGVVDVGLLFLRTRVQAGYGNPHELWGGIQIDPLISTSGVGIYGGVRMEIPHFDIRAGARYRYSFGNSFLFPLDGYDHLTFRDRTLDAASYGSLEAQMTFDIPIGSTAIVGEAMVEYLAFVPDGNYVFDETTRVISPRGLVWSGLLGYRIRFGDDDAFYITPQVEIVDLVQRGAFIVRAGLRAGVRLWPDLEVRLIAMPAWYGPDRLGAAGGDTFLLGIRYLWATDAPRFGN